MKFVLSFLIAIVSPLFCFSALGEVAKDTKKVVAKENDSVAIQFSDLPKLLKEKSGNVKAAQMNISANEERTGHLTRSFLPQIYGSIGQENYKVESRSSKYQGYWNVGASLNLYRGGKDQLISEISDKQLNLSKTEFALSFSQGLLLAQSTYWEIVALEKVIELRKEELKNNHENFLSAKRRAGAGISTNADAVQFELNKSKIDLEIEQIHLKVDQSKSRLAAILAIEASHKLIVGDDFPKEMPVTSVELNLEEQLDLKSMRTAQVVESLKAKHEGRWWTPQLDLYASYGIPALSDDEAIALLNEKEAVLGIKLSIDLGKGLASQSEASAKRFEAKGLEFKADQKEREVLLLDKELRRGIDVSTRLLVENEKSVAKAQDLLKLTQSEYARGLKNGPDLLGAVRQYYETLERSIDLNYNIMKLHADLQSLTTKEEGY